MRILHLKIGTHVRQQDLGTVYFSPIDVVLSDAEVVQPDLLFISNERAEITTQDNLRGAPDLVVEILSPSTAALNRSTKLGLYAQHGVREHWTVDPDANTIMVLLRGENRFEVGGNYGKGHTLQSPTSAGFTVQVEKLFEALLVA